MKLNLKIKFFCLLFFSINVLLSQVPLEKRTPHKMYGGYKFSGDSIILSTYNPLECPIRWEITFQNQSIQNQIGNNSSITLQIGDTIHYIIICNDSIPCEEEPKYEIKIKIHYIIICNDSIPCEEEPKYEIKIKSHYIIICNDSIPCEEKPEYEIKIKYGDLKDKVLKEKYSLPIPRNEATFVMQGYNGLFSHRSDKMNKYAIDFKMSLNDTICATADGYVVGIIDGYIEGRSDIKLKEHANKIRLYHPRSNTFSEYCHLNTNGCLVKLSDFVAQGQAIGLAGNTGYSTEPHLHFVILVPDDSDLGFKSIQTQFIEGYDGNNLRDGIVVIKN